MEKPLRDSYEHESGLHRNNQNIYLSKSTDKSSQGQMIGDNDKNWKEMNLEF